MIESTAESPPKEPDDAYSATAAAPAAPVVGTPVLVWVLYVLGIVGAIVFAASLAFVALAYATNGSGDSGVDVSAPALVLWLLLIAAAVGTFLRRRYGGRR